MPNLSFFEVLDTFFSRPHLRVILGEESTRVTRAEKMRLESERKKDDEVKMMTEVVEEEPSWVDLENSGRSEAESLDMLADSFDLASQSLDNSITWNTDFVAFG